MTGAHLMRGSETVGGGSLQTEFEYHVGGSQTQETSILIRRNAPLEAV